MKINNFRIPAIDVTALVREGEPRSSIRTGYHQAKGRHRREIELLAAHFDSDMSEEAWLALCDRVIGKVGNDGRQRVRDNRPDAGKE